METVQFYYTVKIWRVFNAFNLSDHGAGEESDVCKLNPDENEPDKIGSTRRYSGGLRSFKNSGSKKYGSKMKGAGKNGNEVSGRYDHTEPKGYGYDITSRFGEDDMAKYGGGQPYEREKRKKYKGGLFSPNCSK